jgi:protein-tyrosine kinase
MSTIEKAVDKLGQIKASPNLLEDTVSPSAPDTLEKVVAEHPDRPTPTVAEPDNKALEQLARAEFDSTAPSRPKKATKEVLQIPLAELADKGLLTPLTPSSTLAEEFRTVKRPLLRNIDGQTAAPVKNANLIMVTSALSGDGKTFTAVSLAVSIAMEQDKTVLFIDGDVAKASAGRLLGVPFDHPGLIDVLENKGVSVDDVILPTNIQNLRVMPAGVVHERSTEILASQSMRELMLELSGRYSDRVIIFDSPPLLLTTEASVLASFMGQIAFVVSTDQTPAPAVTEALQHIGDDKIVGMVLNKAHARRNKFLGFSYGSGYGYGYGYGYGHEGRSDSPSDRAAG